MMNMIGSRRIAEHLCTFAKLLEVEAVRASTLGIRLDKDLAREAREVRGIANQLWDANTAIPLDASGATDTGTALCWQYTAETVPEAANQPATRIGGS